MAKTTSNFVMKLDKGIAIACISCLVCVVLAYNTRHAWNVIRPYKYLI